MKRENVLNAAIALAKRTDRWTKKSNQNCDQIFREIRELGYTQFWRLTYAKLQIKTHINSPIIWSKIAMPRRLFSQSLVLTWPIIPAKIIKPAIQRIVSSIDLPYQMALACVPNNNKSLTRPFLGGSGNATNSTPCETRLHIVSNAPWNKDSTWMIVRGCLGGFLALWPLCLPACDATGPENHQNLQTLVGEEWNDRPKNTLW